MSGLATIPAVDYLPVFLDLRGRAVLVVGGGAVALRKIAMLQRAGASITVVAPALDPGVEALAAAGAVRVIRSAFSANHADGMSFIVAATDAAGVNAAVAAAGRERNVFVNAVDDIAASSCHMPAIVDRSPVLVAIGTGGASPTLARRVRALIEAALPAGLGELAAVAARWRERVRQALPDTASRRRFWDRFFDSAGAASGSGGARDHEDALAAALQEVRPDGKRGEVWLIGAGPGDPDLLTLRALQLLQQCDVVLYDRLVGAAVLDRVRRDAERVFVGKESGRHRTTQERINQLLLEYAGRGLRVARLKGGDPLVFGRGGEEIAALQAAGIPVTVVPGVTAALGGAAAAGIPLTHRGVSQSVTFVTAMGSAAEQLDWRALAAPLQTAVFYMGMAQLPRIVAALQAHGAPATRGAAVVERASLPGERAVFGSLADIAARASDAAVQAPALLIVGDVVYQRSGQRWTQGA
jgi:uroporphyrin-III C-methyltransferase/precorrin-2 dehydrogenase/sirohydrochlorin ferrochelatase